MNVTKEQAVAVLDLIVAVGDVIRDAGSIPSGELYVRVADKLSIHSYNSIISTLKGAGVIEEKAYLLRWIGPPKVQA